MAKISKSIVFRVLFVSAFYFLDTTLACGRSSVSIQNNGYTNILIAISEEVPDNPSLLQRIRDVFTEASEVLYRATRNRAYFAEITILVPSSWADDNYIAATTQTFDNADIVVEEPMNGQNAPFVIKNTPCGEPGFNMHLSTQYLLNQTFGQSFGQYGRVLVHEWSHLRYGVFDEYPLEPDGPHFYAASNGRIEAVRCSLEIRGRRIDIETNGRCRIGEDNLPNENCRFEDLDTGGLENGFASLMYRTYLGQIDQYCDDETEDPRLLHNRESPNQQNRLCEGRSVWEVLRDHVDFNGTNEPRQISNLTPNFTVVQVKEEELTTVLVLDVSGSMNYDDRIERLGQGVNNYISNIIGYGDRLGIVTFSTSATRVAELTEINNSTRASLLTRIPTEGSGYTSIGSGVLEAIAMLNGVSGGRIIVVTDGEENREPYLGNITQQIADSQATIHSIAITNAADSNLDIVAAQTGGLSFIYSNSNSSNALNQAFRIIGELGLSPSERSYILQSDANDIAPSSSLTGTASIDATLGRATLFIFDYTGSDVDPTVTSPSGQVFTKTDQIVSKDTTFRIYKFAIPDNDFEAGDWAYRVMNTDANSQRVAVSVSSRSSDSNTVPIAAYTYWRLNEIAAIAPGQTNEQQALYAAVSQGYAPVLNAAVVASVESAGNQNIIVTLADNGAGADTAKNDGIYSAFFVNFDGQGRYGVSLSVNSNDATIISPKRIIGRGAATNIFENPLPAAADIVADNIQRTELGQSFQIADFDDGGDDGGKFYPPGRITDLEVSEVSFENRTITLTWTAVGDQLDQGRASSYELRYATNFSDLSSSFITQELITGDNITEGDLFSPLAAGSTETISLIMSQNGAISYYFAIVARDTDGRDVTGPVSNIVSATLQDFSENDDETADDKLSSFALAALIIGGVFCLIGIFIIVAITSIEPFKTVKRPKYKMFRDRIPNANRPSSRKPLFHRQQYYAGYYPYV